jgi:DnaK suppressor protein
VKQKSQALSRFRERLHNQKTFLEQSMTSAVAQGREVGLSDTTDVADQAVQSYQKELLFSQGTNGHQQLALVRLALERLDEGAFGDCTHCGKAIGIKRLEAIPWTPSCIDCQERIENGELEDPVCAA